LSDNRVRENTAAFRGGNFIEGSVTDALAVQYVIVKIRHWAAAASPGRSLVGSGSTMQTLKTTLPMAPAQRHRINDFNPNSIATLGIQAAMNLIFDWSNEHLKINLLGSAQDDH